MHTLKQPWPKATLGEVLRRAEETVEPVVDAVYREITVRLWGKGVVERGQTLGASLSGRRFVARAGQFIASRIDARNGAMGLVPETLEGGLVTNDFPLFNLNGTRLEPAFLGWLCRTGWFCRVVSASERRHDKSCPAEGGSVSRIGNTAAAAGRAAAGGGTD